MDFDNFLYVNRLKARDLATYLHVADATVSRYVSGQTKPSPANYAKILQNPFGWDVSDIVDESIKVINKGDKNTTTVNYKSDPRSASVDETPDEQPASAPSPIPDIEVSTVPIIPLNAMAGTLSDYTEGIMPYQCDRIVNPFATQATIAIRVNGESMMPKYPNGTLVFCTKVNEKAFIEYSRTYVLDTANGVVIKQVEPSDNDDSITCVSINTKYPPFKLDKQYIYGWWKVVGCVQFE